MVGETRGVHIEHPALVVDCIRISSDHRARAGRRIRALRSHQDPIWRGEVRDRGGIISGGRGPWQQIVAVPTGGNDFSALWICGGHGTGTEAGSLSGWISLHAPPNEIWKWCSAGRGSAPAARLNVGRRDRCSVANLLFEICDDDIQSAPRQEIRFRIVKAGLS